MTTAPKATTDKPTKEKHKIYKEKLHKRIHEVGVHKILYPNNHTGSRHPYTQEIMLLADAKGLRQATIADICGVSQSQVSKWFNGDDKASGEQIGPLIRQVSPLAPGDEFHIKNVIRCVAKKLPENWEREMLTWYIGQQTEYYNGYTEDNLDRDTFGKMADKHKNETEQAGKLFNAELRPIERAINDYRSLSLDAYIEQSDNGLEQNKYQTQRTSYLQENPSFNKMTKEERDNILAKIIQLPEYNDQAQNALRDFATKLKEKFRLNGDNIEEELDAMKTKLQSGYEAEKQKLAQKHEQEREQLAVQNRFSREALTDSIDFTFHDQTPVQLKSTAQALYGDMQFSITATDSSHSYYRKAKPTEVTALYRDIFISYVMEKLPAKAEMQEIQLCGTELYNNNDIEVYQLFSNRLALISSHEVEDVPVFIADNGEEKEIYTCDYLQMFESAEELLNGLPEDSDSKTATELRQKLLDKGYLFSNVQTIY